MTKKEDKDKIIPEIMPEKKDMGQMLELLSITAQKGGLQPDIAKKITSEHIDKTLEISKDTNNKIHKDGIYDRIFNFLVFIITIAFLIFLIFSLKDSNANLLSQLIQYIIVGAGGFGAGIGFGYKKFKQN